MDAMAGTSAAILDYDMTLSVEAMLQDVRAEGLKNKYKQTNKKQNPE